MTKRSYQINNILNSKPLTGPAPENNDVSATETGGRGFSSTEMTTDYDMSNSGNNDDSLVYKSKNNNSYEDVMDLLVLLGDEMDAGDNESLAGFSDFLLKKFAEAEDFTKKYNELMLKINNADLANTNEILKKLTKIYSRTILLEFNGKQSLAKSKESAYKKVLHRAEQYLQE